MQTCADAIGAVDIADDLSIFQIGYNADSAGAGHNSRVAASGSARRTSVRHGDRF